jgi:hypothetical protein
MKGLFYLLFRILSGERFRKATTTEKRWGGAAFVFLPIYMFSFVRLGQSFLSRASPVGIFLFMMGSLLVFLLCLFIWARYIPTLVSVVVGVVVWVFMCWMSIIGRFFG